MRFVDAWAITWVYNDESDYGVVRVHVNEDAAELDLKNLQEHANGMRRYDLKTTQLVKE